MHVIIVGASLKVIEQLPKLSALIAELARLLDPVGAIVIRAPGIGHWGVPRSSPERDEVKPPAPLYHFKGMTSGWLRVNHGLNRRK